VAIDVDVKLALSDGLKFYRSSNNVILCPGDETGFLKPKYFLRAEDLKQGILKFLKFLSLK
jgi:2'-phosphotransferase